MSSPCIPPAPRVLIVEDEIFVAADLEATLEDLGYDPIGIAADRETAFALAEQRPDIALVDLNLRDGETGMEIGRLLGAKGIAVLYMTANPRSLGDGVPGTLGVVGKPADGETIAQALGYICARRWGGGGAPPAALRAFA